MYIVYFNLKSFDLNLLNQTEKYLLSIFSFFQFNEIKHQRKPKKCKKITVLRSPHIDKKSREQFQQITHKKLISVSIPNKNLVLVLFEILKTLNFPGVENHLAVEFSTY